jgi:hypothetical protein
MIIKMHSEDYIDTFSYIISKYKKNNRILTTIKHLFQII